MMTEKLIRFHGGFAWLQLHSASLCCLVDTLQFSLCLRPLANYTLYKGFRLSFVLELHLDIDCYVSTAYLWVCCRSSSGDKVDLPSRIICTSMVVRDWWIANLVHGYWFLLLRELTCRSLRRSNPGCTAFKTTQTFIVC